MAGAAESGQERPAHINGAAFSLFRQHNVTVRMDPNQLQGGLLVDLEPKSYNGFHVPEARGSTYVPAQETFVIPYGIRSVVGLGGLFSPGHLFAVILFTTVPIPRHTADLFGPLALSVKLAILPVADRRTGGA